MLYISYIYAWYTLPETNQMQPEMGAPGGRVIPFLSDTIQDPGVELTTARI